MNNVAHPLSSADIRNFSPKVSKFCFIKKHMYKLHFDTKFLILLTFLESVKMKWLHQAFLKKRFLK